MTAAVASKDAPAVRPSTVTPRILLYGRPQAGKTWLLGALARVAEVQERTLGGRLTDAGQSLRGVRDQVYQRAAKSPVADIVEHRLRLDPFAEGEPVDVVLVDCAGAPTSGRPLPPERLADQLYKADAVLFVLDAAAAPDRVEADYGDFGRFLAGFRNERGRRTDEPELPVFLVLAQCDRLAKPGDTLSVWTERLEMRKEEAAQRFEEVVQQTAGPTFGSLSFTTVATAIKHPALANVKEMPEEPFGVAEVFHDALEAAKEYASRRVRSEVNVRRLVMMAAGIAALIAVFAIIAPLIRNYFQPPSALQTLTAYRNSEGPPPSGHLAEPLASKLDELVALSSDSSFGRLSAADRDFVKQRLEELGQYSDYKASLRRATQPVEARSLDELQRLEKSLNGELNFPEAYATAWASSDAGKKRELWLKQIAGLQSAVQTALTAFDNRRRTLDELYVIGDRVPDWSVWSKKVEEALGAGAPLKADEQLNVPTADNAPITNNIILTYSEVGRAKQRWEESLKRLTTFRDIAAVVGLTPLSGPTLRVPEDFSAGRSSALLAALLTKYPNLASWGSPDVPDVAAGTIKAAARTAYEQLLPAGRAAVWAALGSPVDGTESLPQMRKAVDSIGGNTTLKAWNEVARLALRLAGANTDPLGELSAFIRRTEFPLEIQAVDVIIPGGTLTPAGGSLTIMHNTKKVFSAPSNATGERIRFTAVDKKPLVYRPGESLYAELGVKDKSGTDMELSWHVNGFRSKLYQIERLTLTPRLRRLDALDNEGQPAVGVRLEFQPPGALPKVPDLLPEMK